LKNKSTIGKDNAALQFPGLTQANPRKSESFVTPKRGRVMRLGATETLRTHKKNVRSKKKGVITKTRKQEGSYRKAGHKIKVDKG